MKYISLNRAASLEELTAGYRMQLKLDDNFSLNFDALDEVLAEACDVENEDISITHDSIDLVDSEFKFYLKLLSEVQNSREKNRENFIELIFQKTDHGKFTAQQIAELRRVSFV